MRIQILFLIVFLPFIINQCPTNVTSCNDLGTHPAPKIPTVVLNIVVIVVMVHTIAAMRHVPLVVGIALKVVQMLVLHVKAKTILAVIKQEIMVTIHAIQTGFQGIFAQILLVCRLKAVKASLLII